MKFWKMYIFTKISLCKKVKPILHFHRVSTFWNIVTNDTVWWINFLRINLYGVVFLEWFNVNGGLLIVHVLSTFDSFIKCRVNINGWFDSYGTHPTIGVKPPTFCNSSSGKKHQRLNMKILRIYWGFLKTTGVTF